MVQDEIKYRLVLRSAEVSLGDSLRKVTDHGCRFVGDFKREREDSSDPKTAPETPSDLKFQFMSAFVDQACQPATPTQ